MKSPNGTLLTDVTFGSHYDQADGQDVTYKAGTPVRVEPSQTLGMVWVTAPNGRTQHVHEDTVRTKVKSG